MLKRLQNLVISEVTIMNYTINDFELTHLGKQAVLSHSIILERFERLILNYVGSYSQSNCKSHRQQITQMFHRLVDKVNLTRLVVMKFLKFRGACVQGSKLISQVKEQCALYSALTQTDTMEANTPQKNSDLMDNGMLVKQKTKTMQSSKIDDVYVLELKKRLKNRSRAMTKHVSDSAQVSENMNPMFNIINGEYLYSA